MKRSWWSTGVYWAIAPVIVLLIANIVYNEITGPRGPFGEGEARMVLLNNAINYLLADVFQGFLVLFLIVVAANVRSAYENPRGEASSNSLPIVLVLIYALSAVCAVLLALGRPSFLALLVLGLLIVGLSWAAVVLAVMLRARAANAT